ncbi:MAG TPA: cytochrome c biogenesis protein CcsA [Opitutales bacterium]|nr:cytochrome c biogenesis protein CcsA [Opitutales bacterium]
MRKYTHFLTAAVVTAWALSSFLWGQSANSYDSAEPVPSHGSRENPALPAEPEHIHDHGVASGIPGEIHSTPSETSAFDPAILMPDHDYSELEGLIIQQGGRKKPLLTFARESLLTLAGRSKFEISEGVKVTPMPFIVSIWLSGRDWSDQPLIRVDHPDLKEELGLELSEGRFSFREIVSSPNFQSIYEEVEAVRAADGAEAFTEFQRNFDSVAQRLMHFRVLQNGSAFTVVPHPDEVEGTWVSVPDGAGYYSGEDWANLNRETILLFAAYHGEPLEKDFVTASRDFRQLQHDLSPSVMPPSGKIEAELIYEHYGFMRYAWILAFVSAIVLSLTWTSRKGLLVGWGIGLLALLMLVVGMGFRVYISGRAPVTNMYETVIWVSFGLLLFALIFEWRYKCRYYLVCGAVFAGVLLILADSVPAILDPNITPLTAVLRDNFWLTTHVLTVTISYAAFALAFALGHVVLAKQIIEGPKMKENRYLYAYIYRAMQVGILLLTIGVILGGVWANYSWGRFWGWDPKETWSLIAILCYLFVLHGRLAGWWRGFGNTVGAVLSFMSVIMCWYGVNYILGAGLHSYGFGTGGTGYVVAFVVFELLFVGAALYRRYQGGANRSRRRSKVKAKKSQRELAQVEAES